MYQDFNNTPTPMSTIQPQMTDKPVTEEKAKRKKIIKIASVFFFIFAVIIVVCVLLSLDSTIIYRGGDDFGSMEAEPVTSYKPKHVTPGFTANDLLGSWSCSNDKSFIFTNDSFTSLNKLDDDEVGYSGSYSYDPDTNLITFDIDSIVQNGEKKPITENDTWQNEYSVSKEEDKLLLYPDDDNAYVCERKLDD